MNLEKGQMSVADYEVQFTRLSHYARHMVMEERHKCRRFEGGLQNEIKKMITMHDLENFQRLRAVAIRAERLLELGKSKDEASGSGLGKRKSSNPSSGFGSKGKG